MRILLTANASYLPPRGGATRSNLLWLEYLASSGHECRVVAGALADTPEKRHQAKQEQIHAEWATETGRRRRGVAARQHHYLLSRRARPAAGSSAPPDQGVSAALGAGVVGGSGPRPAARGFATSARTHRIFGAHSAVFPLRSGELESR